MTYGVTSTGFNLKRLSAIKEDMKADLLAAFPDLLLTDETVEGQITSIFADAAADLWELFEDIYNASDPTTAEDYSLDVLCSLSNVKRLAANYSSATIRIFGTPATVVSAGFLVGVQGTDYNFATDEDATIAAAVDEVQTITFSDTPDAGSWTITFGSETTSSLVYNVSAANVKSALEALSGIDTVTVTGTMAAGFVVTFTGALVSGTALDEMSVTSSLTKSAASVSAAVAETTEGGSYIDVAATATETGAITGNAGYINTIINPDPDITDAYNKTDATVGRALESNIELRERRLDKVTTSRSGTDEAIRQAILDLNDDETDSGLVIENCTVISNRTKSTLPTGQTASSFQAFVWYEDQPDATKDQAIAQAIFDSMPAGIEPYGAVSKTITDTYGISQTVSFSRPDEIDIYVQIELGTSSEFPVDGETQVKAAVAEWGNGLGVGKDVIVYGYNSLINAIGSIIGVIDITVLKVGTTNPPTTDANITIDDGSSGNVEIARFDTSRVSII